MRSANLFGPLKGLCPHKALIGLTQASGLAGGFDSKKAWGCPHRSIRSAASDRRSAAGPTQRRKGVFFVEITIRKADAADLDAVVRVYEHVHDAEEAGPAQVGWVRGVYPVRSTAEARWSGATCSWRRRTAPWWAPASSTGFRRTFTRALRGSTTRRMTRSWSCTRWPSIRRPENGALAAPSPHFTSSTPGSMAAGICASTPTRELKHYTLQMIIAVGFKVNNPRAV